MSAAPTTSMIGLLALLSILPLAAVMLTSFSKMAIVLSIARSAMGSHQAPPAMVLTGLAAVLSGHVMAPVAQSMLDRISSSSQREGGSWSFSQVASAAEPLRSFLIKHGSVEERTRFTELSSELSGRAVGPGLENDFGVIVPAFVVTELKDAFRIGFLVYLPFLIVDLVIANILLALGMQSLPPSQISLPFKLLLFVAVDGWGLISRGLILGYR